MVKISKLAALGGGRIFEGDPLQSLIPRKLSLFDCLGGSLEYPTCKAVFINQPRACSVWKAFSQGPLRKYLEVII